MFILFNNCFNRDFAIGVNLKNEYTTDIQRTKKYSFILFHFVFNMKYIR